MGKVNDTRRAIILRNAETGVQTILTIGETILRILSNDRTSGCAHIPQHNSHEDELRMLIRFEQKVFTFTLTQTQISKVLTKAISILIAFDIPIDFFLSFMYFLLLQRN